MSLEKDIAKLSKIAESLEEGQLTLDESLKAFEESIVIADKCLKELNDYNGKLTVLQTKINDLKGENND